jgi:hypothetical protein
VERRGPADPVDENNFKSCDFSYGSLSLALACQYVVPSISSLLVRGQFLWEKYHLVYNTVCIDGSTVCWRKTLSPVFASLL